MIKHFSLSILLACNCAFAIAEDVTPEKPLENQGQKDSDNPPITKLEPMQIRASTVEKDYLSPNATSATKIDVPVRDVPQSIQTVTKELIQDQGGLARVNELGRNVSGVFIQEPGNGGSNTASYMIRGFSTSFFQLVDGVRRTSSFTSPDAATLESIEFLKGPASVLYGTSGGSHGGLVNFITKKPSAVPVSDIELTSGSYGFVRTALDLGGALNEDHTVLGRINFAAEKGNSFRDGIKHDTEVVSPALTWIINSDNKLTAQLDYTRSFYVNDWGWPVDPIVLTYPRNLNLGEPSYEGINNKSTYGVLRYEHNFNDKWKFQSVASHGNVPSKGCQISKNIDDPVNTPNIVTRFPGCYSSKTLESDLQLELVGDVNYGPIGNKILAGVQFTPTSSKNTNDFGSTIAPFDVLNPVHGDVVTPPIGTTSFELQTNTSAIYLQDLIAIGPQVKLLLGARHDRISSKSKTDSVETDSHVDSHLSPRIGIVYQPSDATAVYANYSNSFNPNFGRLRDGSIPSPEQGVQYETGLKQDLLGGRANLNLAIYQLTKEDSAQCDPTDPSCNFVVLIGEQRSRGLEIDLTGKVTDNLRLTLASAFNDSVVTKDSSIPIGSRLVGAPERTFSLFGVYTLPAGWELGSGFYYASKTEGAFLGASNPFKIPAVKKIDLYASYNISSKLKLQVNLNNVTDEKNYLSNGFSPWPDHPRELYATLRSSF
jgi:iron complex outermembrane receptor protein